MITRYELRPSGSITQRFRLSARKNANLRVHSVYSGIVREIKAEEIIGNPYAECKSKDILLNPRVFAA